MSAGIFVVLAVGWAGYLIPKALKHHDEVARTRSVDRFSQTMRVLSRREVVAPARAADNPRVVVPTDRPSRARLQAQRRAAAAAARRRRRILIFLLLANVVVGTLIALGELLRWSAAIPAGITLGYLLLCRVLVKRERRRSRRPAALVAVVEQPAEPAVRLRDPQGFEQISPDEDTTSIDVSALAAGLDVPVADGASFWDPLPVTLPTYVGKPAATRTVRTIDLSAPDVSSSGHDASDSELAAHAGDLVPEADQPEQRAVNS